MALVYAIVKAETDGWTSATTIGFFALAAVLLVAFVVIEQRSKAPLVRLSIFRVRSLPDGERRHVPRRVRACSRCSSSTRSTSSACSATGRWRRGSRSCPFTAGIMVSAGLASQFAPRVGVRPVAIVGMVVTAAGMLLLTRLPVDGTYVADVLPALLLTSLGMGAVFMPLTLIATTGPRERGPGPRLRPLQHLAADRRRARARDPLDARGEQDRSAGGARAGGARHGFHWAFAARRVVRARRARRRCSRSCGSGTSRGSRPRPAAAPVPAA